jgi:hypothetical protein
VSEAEQKLRERLSHYLAYMWSPITPPDLLEILNAKDAENARLSERHAALVKAVLDGNWNDARDKASREK